jgi:hypothetical protein
METLTPQQEAVLLKLTALPPGFNVVCYKTPEGHKAARLRNSAVLPDFNFDFKVFKSLVRKGYLKRDEKVSRWFVLTGKKVYPTARRLPPVGLKPRRKVTRLETSLTLFT